jgi:hypothetical protein
MDQLHPILGHIITIDDNVKCYGLKINYCSELSDLVDMALIHMNDPELDEKLVQFKLNMMRGVDMLDSFTSLIDMSIINISSYIHPLF